MREYKIAPGKWLYNLKYVARAKGVSNHWLAFKTGLSYDRIVAIRGINGKATPEEIELIAKALGVTVDALGPVEAVENVPKIEKRPKEKKFFLKGLSAEKARSGLTYNELAERSGLPIGRLHRFAEQRQAATWREAQSIADFLGCPVEHLRLTE